MEAGRDYFPTPNLPPERDWDRPLTADEYNSSLDRGGSYPDQALAALSNVETNSVLVSICVLGNNYRPTGYAASIYWIGVRTRVAPLRDRFAAMSPIGGGQRAQLALANDLVSLDPRERRDLILGWSLRPIEDR